MKKKKNSYQIYVENMLYIVTGKVSKRYKKKKIDTRLSKIMDKYAKMKRFHYDRRLQFYMYSFMYVDPETLA